MICVSFYALKGVTLKDATVVLVPSLPLATVFIDFTLGNIGVFFVLIMANINLFTGVVAVFKENVFNVVVSYRYLEVSFQALCLKLRVSSWLAQSKLIYRLILILPTCFFFFVCE